MATQDAETLDRRVGELEAQLASARAERFALQQQLAAETAEHAEIMRGPARDVVGRPKHKKVRDNTLVALLVMAVVSAGLNYLMWMLRR